MNINKDIMHIIIVIIITIIVIGTNKWWHI